MSKSNTPLFVVLSTDDMDLSQVEEINSLTRELAQSFENQPEAVQTVSYVQKNELPQGAKVAGELIFAQQMILTIAPLMIPWVLGKIDSVIKSFSSRGKQVKAKVLIGNREVQITPKTTSYDLNKAAQQVTAISELSPNKRFALVIGNSNYLDTRLSNLNSSVVDAERFAEVLADPHIGSFDQVERITNKKNDEIEQAIERFFSNKNREDLLLLYFSGHGIKSQSGQLFLAAQNTTGDFLRSTGVSANFIKENMGESESQRQILILDCCYGGAIIEGSKSDNLIGQNINSVLSFQSSGFGRIIITASESMQYAFDGKHIEGQTQNSAFTGQLIEGLRTGKADTDNDGLIDIDELYQYAFKHVIPHQTPNMSSTAQEGRMFIGLNPNPTIRSAELSEHIRQAMQSETRLHRQGAVSELARLLKSEDPSIIFSAETALRKMINDDSKSVGDLAQDTLNQHYRTGIKEHKSHLQESALPKSSSVPNVTVDPSTQVSSIPVATQQVGVTKTKKMNEIFGGFLNIIIPGFAHAMTGRWSPAIITFITATVIFLALIFVTGASGFGLFICTGPLAIVMFVYLFFQGRKAFHAYNEKQS